MELKTAAREAEVSRLTTEDSCAAEAKLADVPQMGRAGPG